MRGTQLNSCHLQNLFNVTGMTLKPVDSTRNVQVCSTVSRLRIVLVFLILTYVIRTPHARGCYGCLSAFTQAAKWSIVH